MESVSVGLLRNLVLVASSLAISFGITSRASAGEDCNVNSVGSSIGPAICGANDLDNLAFVVDAANLNVPGACNLAPTLVCVFLPSPTTPDIGDVCADSGSTAASCMGAGGLAMPVPAGIILLPGQFVRFSAVDNPGLTNCVLASDTNCEYIVAGMNYTAVHGDEIGNTWRASVCHRGTTVQNGFDNQSSNQTNVPAKHPDVDIEKSVAPGKICEGTSTQVTYTYTVQWGPMATLLSNLDNVVVTDTTCGPVIRGADTPGNNNLILEQGEVWNYSCTTSISTATTNTGTVNADDACTGLGVDDSDQATVESNQPLPCCLDNDTCILTCECPTLVSGGDACTLDGCCFGDECVNLDPDCCLAAGGQPEGALCTTEQGCCFGDVCENMDPLCCIDQGGTPEGAGNLCTTVQGCCFDNDSCENLDPLCCIDQGGTPEGAGNLCTTVLGCCLPDGTCADMDPLCCADQMGEVQMGLCTESSCGGAEGCTPGYWKLLDSSPANASHECNWTDPYDPNDNYDATFGVDSKFDSQTLIQALKLGGGGEKAMRRHSVAALLNAASCAVNYAYSVAEVIAAVQAAYATPPTKTFSEVHTMFAAANEAEDGCPLGNCNNGAAPCDEAPDCGNCQVASGVPGCSDPVCQGIVCAIDPFCCDVSWDGICAGEATANCNCGVAPGCGDCETATGALGCSDPVCQGIVCAIDPFCCSTSWDSICAGEATANCNCGAPLTGPSSGEDAGFKNERTAGPIQRTSEVDQNVNNLPLSSFAPVSACGATGLMSLCALILGMAGLKFMSRKPLP